MHYFCGSLAVLNLEGVQSRYEKPEEILHQIAAAPGDKVAALIQQVYSQPIREQFVGERIRTIKKMGGICAVSVTPANTKRLAPVMVGAGADVLAVQSTVTTARHSSKSLKGLIFSELCRSVPIPVVVGNCVSYSAALELMKTGIAGLLVGVGPGATCTTRQVLGIGVPQPIGRGVQAGFFHGLLDIAGHRAGDNRKRKTVWVVSCGQGVFWGRR